MDEQRRLLSLLSWAFVLAAVCGAGYGVAALVVGDRDLFLTAIVDLALVVAIGVARAQARRGRVERAASIFALSMLAAITCALPVFSYAWPIMVLGAILAVTAVSPYLRGRWLIAIIALSVIVEIVPTFVGLFLIEAPQSILQKGVMLVSTVVGSTLIVVMLVHLVQQLQRNLEQARRLHEVTSRLSRSLPADEIARIVLEHGRAIASANTAGIWLVEQDELVLLSSLDYPESARSAYQRIALEPTVPIALAVLEKTPIWLTTRKEYAARFPESEQRARLHNHEVQLSVACIPLEAEGRVIGVTSFAFYADRIFDRSEQSLLLALNHHCAQALVTARLLAQEREAREAARAADRRKDEFLALLGHELRNPLAPIATAIEVMKLRGVAERELPVLERQVHHLIGLVDDLLDVSRITRGKIRLEKKRIDLAAAIDDAVEMTSPLIEKRKHSLAIEVPRQRLWVEVDPRRLAQVIANLLTNAARYTEPGGKIRVLAEEGDPIRVSVEDNGQGIDPQQIASLFEPFAQGEQQIDRSGGGLGLGLMLVKSLMELHGGTVAVHSEGKGRGSRFTLLLPAAPRAIEAEQARPAAGSGKSVHRVLVVDDNQDAADSLAKLLEAFGCLVAVAYDGPSALEVAGEFRPSVSILDIGLPVMDGFELCRRLRASLGDGARFLALSGYGQEEDRQRSVRAGFEAHLVKPIDAQALMAALDRAHQTTSSSTSTG